MGRSETLGIIVAAMIGLGASGAMAAPPADTGTAVGVDASAFARDRAATRTLVVGSDVKVGERVVTGVTGQVQIVFDDDTHLVVGPKSSLLIEAYLLRRDKSVGRFTIDALNGTFRFITGKSPKNAYEIKTPTGTIGVRGTAFDFVAGKRTVAVLFHGAIHMCSLSGQCIDLVRRCAVGAFDATSATTLSRNRQQQQNLRAQFRYVRFQNPLLPEFRVTRAFTCLPEPPVHGAIVTVQSSGPGGGASGQQAGGGQNQNGNQGGGQNQGGGNQNPVKPGP